MNVIALYQNNDTNELHHRRLQVEDGGVSSNTGDSRARYIQKVYFTKTEIQIHSLNEIFKLHHNSANANP